MARQARILDFEEARSSSSKRASKSSTRNARSSSRAAKSGGAAQSQSRTGRSKRSGGQKQTRTGGSASVARSSSSTRNAKASKTRSGKTTSSRTSSKQRNTQAAKKSSASRQASTRNKSASRVEKVKRDMAKRKADQMFERTVRKDATENDGPRAALYKTKMGSSHKKAARMQNQGRAASAFGSVAGSAASFASKHFAKLNTKGGLVLLVCVCLIAGCAFLYAPVKNYYFAVREQAKAEAAYEMAIAHNDALKEDVALLVTDEGMEDRARQQYGWVKEGENAVLVSGLSTKSEPSAAEVLRTTSPDALKAPETWYSPFLDSVFGYE